MSHDLTHLLRAWGDGDRSAAENLFPLVYDELRTVARGQVGATGTVHPTALVHDAFIEMAGAAKTDWRERKQFFAFAAVVMRRRLVVDHARRQGAGKRGHGARTDRFEEELHALIVFPASQAVDLEGLDEALTRLCATRWTTRTARGCVTMT